MPTRIAWTTSAEVSTGIAIQGGQAVEVGAIDQVSVSVPAKPADDPAVPVQVEIQPSNQAADLRFFALVSNRYSADLAFTVDGGTEDIPLEAPLFVMGGAVSVLLGAPPQSVTVTNGSDQPVEITLLVGRQT